MKLHLIQISVNEKKPEENLEKSLKYIDNIEVSEKEPNLAILPELFIPGYDEKNIIEYGDKGTQILEIFSQKAIEKKISILCGTISISENGKRYNRSVLIDNTGKIIGHYNKTHLFRILKEDIYFTNGTDYPVLEFDKSWKVGLNICYDMRFPEGTKLLALKGANLIIVPSAWPHSRMEILKKLSFARAIENQIYLVVLNRASHSYEKLTYGGNSMVIAPDGELLLECSTLDDYKSISIDIGVLNKYRQTITSSIDRRKDLYQIKLNNEIY